MGNRIPLPVVLESESATLAVLIWIWNTLDTVQSVALQPSADDCGTGGKPTPEKRTRKKITLLFKLTFLCELSGSIQNFWNKVQCEHQYPATAG